MTIKELLMNDFKSAMKEKDIIKKNVITMLRSDIKKQEIDSKSEMDDSMILELIQKQIKVKNKAIVEFENGGRTDLVDEAKKEIEILSKYLPKQVSDEFAIETIKKIIADLNASTMKDMGKVMSEAKKVLANKFDMSKLSAIVKQELMK